MIAHAMLHISNYQKAKDFYIKALAPLGYTTKEEHGESAGFFDGKNTDLWIIKKDKVIPTHIAFQAKNKDEVAAFHAAALKAGAKDNGRPGYRTEYWPGYYAAFAIDPDGHNLEAVWWDYSALDADTK